jgi:hypothetical protein
LKKYNSLL